MIKPTVMSKKAKTIYGILPLLEKRWSPRAFYNVDIEKEKMKRIIEASRWSPSSMNEQPWNYILGIRGENKTYEKILETLIDFNKQWAKNAHVLIIACGKKHFSKKNEPNPTYLYDVGQSVAHMSIQAMHEGVYVHQMGGFFADKARELFGIPEEFDPITVLAMGYIGSPDMLSDELKEREIQERNRKDFSEFIFEDKFGKKSNLF